MISSIDNFVCFDFEFIYVIICYLEGIVEETELCHTSARLLGSKVFGKESVRGVAVLFYYILVVTEKSPSIDVFHLGDSSYKCLKSLVVSDLQDPWDIIVNGDAAYVSERDIKCLYKINIRYPEGYRDEYFTKIRFAEWRFSHIETALSCTRSDHILEICIECLRNEHISISACDKWTLNSAKTTISLTNSAHILASCMEFITEFDPDGEILRQIPLGNFDGSPWTDAPLHAIQLSSGEFVVCENSSQRHRLSLLNLCFEGIRTYGEPSKLDSKPLQVPRYLARCQNDFILVADQDNDRVLLMSPTLELIKEFVLPSSGCKRPNRIVLDEISARLVVVGEDGNKIFVYKLEHIW